MTRSSAIALLASVLSFSQIAPASAQDATSAMPGQKQLYDWSGFYAGFHLGGLSGNSDISALSAAGVEVFGWSLAARGLDLGFFAGLDVQMDSNLVIGLEGEWNWVDASDLGTISSFTGGAGGGTTLDNAKIEINNSAALKARVGYAVDRALIYLSGGLAWTSYDGSVTRTVGGVPSNNPAYWSDSAFGWTVGAGAEFALTDQLTGRVDYRYSDFGDLYFAPIGAGGSNVVGNLSTHEVRMGFSVRF